MDDLIGKPLNDDVMHIRVPSSSLGTWRECADELGMPLSEWVRDACDMYRAKFQPALRFERDLEAVPAAEKRAWAKKHADDPRYQETHHL